MQLQKTLAFLFKAPLLCTNYFFQINQTRKLFWNSNLNEPQRKNFLWIIIQFSEVEIQQSSEFFLIIVIQMSSLLTWLILKWLSLISIRNSASITLNLGIF